MQTQIEFRRNCAHSTLGNFQPGDLLRCSPALAKHFVDLGDARYTEPAAPASTAAVKKPARRRKAGAPTE